MANFDLSKCQEVQPNLFRCPAVDRPLCNPDFNDASVVCVKIGKKGELFQTIGTE